MAKYAHGDQPPQRSFLELKQAEMTQTLKKPEYIYLQPEEEPEHIQIQERNQREQVLGEE